MRRKSKFQLIVFFFTPPNSVPFLTSSLINLHVAIARNCYLLKSSLDNKQTLISMENLDLRLFWIDFYKKMLLLTIQNALLNLAFLTTQFKSSCIRNKNISSHFAPLQTLLNIWMKSISIFRENFYRMNDKIRSKNSRSWAMFVILRRMKEIWHVSFIQISW